MRSDGPVKDLTESQKLMADTAGIPQDRPGLYADYPKMVYRPGNNPNHHILGEPLPIGNGADCETALVDDADDEEQALADGWYLSPDPAAQKLFAEKKAADRAKDDEIATLKAQLAAQSTTEEVRRGPGRPPNREPNP